MVFQDNMHSVHLRTVQQLKGMNAHIIQKKCLLPVCSQTYSFYPLSSSTVPTVTAFAPFPIIYILLRGVTNSWVDTDTPSTARHTHRLPGAPSKQGSTKKSLQPAIIHSSTQLVPLYKLPAVLMENGELFVSLHKG